MLPDLAFRITAQASTAAAFAKTRGELRGIRGELVGLAAAGKAFVGSFVAGAGIAGLLQFARAIGDVVDRAGDLVDLAHRVGITTDRLQELAFAGKQVGIELSDVSDGMEIFGRNLGTALRGGGDLADILKANHVALRDQAGAVRDTSDLLFDFADLVKNASSEEEKLTLVQAAFGKSGAQWVNLLDKGSAALHRAAGEAHDFGAVIDEGLLNDADKIGDEWDKFTARLSGGFQTVVLTIVSGTATAMGNLIDFVNKAAQLPAMLADNLANPPPGSVPAVRASPTDGRPARGYRDYRPMIPPRVPRRAGDDIVTDGSAAGYGQYRPMLGPPATPTVIPSKRDPTRDKIEEVIDALKLQEAQLGRTDKEQAEYNALAQAGIDRSHEMAPAVIAASDALYEHEQALKAALEAQDRLNGEIDFFKDVAYDAFSDLITGAKSFEEVLLRLIEQLAEAALQAALLGSGPFGNGGGGAFGAVASAVVGAFTGGHAAGGFIPPGKFGVAGEEGPEFVFGGKSGATVFSNRGTGSGAPTINIFNNAGVDVQAKHRKGSDGRDLIEFILNTVGAGMADGRLDGQLQGRFGGRPLTRRLSGR